MSAKIIKRRNKNADREGVKMEWDLSVLYHSFEDEALLADFESLTPLMQEVTDTLASKMDALAVAERTVGLLSRLKDTFTKLSAYTHLTLAVDAEHIQANALMDRLLAKEIPLSLCFSAFTRFLGRIPDPEELIGGSLILKAHDYFVRRGSIQAAHTIDEALEPWILKMSLSGGEAFAQLRDKLDATHMVPFRGEAIPLSAVRAKAYDPDPVVRKDAYEAELASYDKIALPMSYCLNSIKAETDVIRQARHFDSILDMTLFDSSMEKETLQAMWTAVDEFLPDFRRYMRAKARLLKHEDGLPFYDLFAPLGAGSKQYTVDEARQTLIQAFQQFNPDMASFIDNAFEKRWIDMFPRKGKRGGAFCAAIHCLGISRILTNFAGSFSDVSTLAHELGHAWHDYCLKDMPVLMTDCPMPLAETASIFNETMLTHQALQSADDAQAFALIESELMEATQTVVDIKSRYLFETEVIDTRRDHTLSVEELKDVMLRAQNLTYGDGLDKAFRHPFMWACKPHYYFTGLSFYNFPYAFGLLFGKGVFARYLAKGSAFIPEYNRLLAASGSDTITRAAASVGIDVNSVDFWRSSLDVIRSSIDRFCSLAKAYEA